MKADRYEYPFTSRFVRIDGVSIHYLDEGEGPVIWMLHGMPTWSYVYRKMIPPLVKAGFRCVVPDLMGFGLSDKPQAESAHDLRRHIHQMTRLIEILGLKDIIVMGQDWGGPIALRYAIGHKKNVSALVLLNTFVQRFPANRKERRQMNIITGPLPLAYKWLFKSGIVSSVIARQLDVFRKFVWLKWRSGNPSVAMGAGFRRAVNPEAMRNYRAPNDTAGKRAGIAAFAKLIPDSAGHENSAIIDQILEALKIWKLPVLVCWPDGDMAWKPEEGRRIAAVLPDAEFVLVPDTGHYLQEDAGGEVADHVCRFLTRRLQPAGKPESPRRVG